MADVVAAEPEVGSAFTVLKQKLHLDFSFYPRLVRGTTAIEILPLSRKLTTVQLNCRQLRIKAVRVNGKSISTPEDIGYDYSDLYKRVSLHPGTDIYQHHFPRARIRRHAQNLEIELDISLPKEVQIVKNTSDDLALNAAANNFGSLDDLSSPTINLEIDYVLEDFRDGLHFAGVEDGDARYPHAYTRNTPYTGTACSIFPCVDDGVSKCPFDISVRYPRTLGDTYGKHRGARNGTNGAEVNVGSPDSPGSPKADSVMSDVDDDPAEFSEEEKALEMAVICSGELTDDISDPADPSHKTASFTCAVPILPQHVGILVGPFQHVDLSDYRDTQDDDRLGSNAIRVHGFCLPGREEDVRNSAMMLARTLDSFTERYQSYPFEKAFKIAFVDDLECDVTSSASLAICSSRLLFPESVWEPLEDTTRKLVHAVASQWIGINVTPSRPNDHWIIVGGSWFMAEAYLKELFGRNDNRYRHKLMADRVIKLDVRRPSLYDLGEYLSLDQGEMEFMQLKATVVLYILHNRLVKQSGKNGVDRCLYRLLFSVRNEKLPNGIISTDQFLDICEKVGHQKLDTFFNQWVHGSGCPTFECYPSFNKKKQVIQLTIKQTQGDASFNPEDRSISATDFLRETKEKANGFRPNTEWPAFVGPMTIRVHESDGTPYEHIVDINSSTVKVEIPYNTKYKRNKRNRLIKEREAADPNEPVVDNGELQEDITIYELGNLYQKEEEIAEWRIATWSADDRGRMDQESYEWLRVDADFEWISKANINDMPAYMYVAQLQQDKDVAAQIDSIQWLSLKEGHPLISSILVKTLMDARYFHGVRTLSAEVMAGCARKDLDWIGLFHLKKAFRALFCIDETLMTRSNDFSDRATYIIQCAIPRAIAKIKGADGKAPLEVKQFLLDIMRYNDNRGNDFSDEHYLATLMGCLAQTLTLRKGATINPFNLDFSQQHEESEFQKKAIEELRRHQRLDEWIPTYHNIYTTTALECGYLLMKDDVVPIKPSEFLEYTRIGNADNVRLKAWECLIELGVIRKDSILRYIVNEIASDPSPYFRKNLLRVFSTALGQVAIGEDFKRTAPKEQDSLGMIDVVHTEETTTRETDLARKKLDGALRALKAEFNGNETLRDLLESALASKTTSVQDVAELLEICTIFYTPVSKLPVIIKYPKFWKVQHTGDGKLRFYHSDKYRTKAKALPLPPTPALPPPPLPLHAPATSLGQPLPLPSAPSLTPTVAPLQPPSSAPFKLKLMVKTPSSSAQPTPTSEKPGPILSLSVPKPPTPAPAATPVKSPKPASVPSPANVAPANVPKPKKSSQSLKPPKANPLPTPSPTTSAAATATVPSLSIAAVPSPKPSLSRTPTPGSQTAPLSTSSASTLPPPSSSAAVQKAPSTSKPTPTPKVTPSPNPAALKVKPKKTKIVKLRIAPEKLRAFPHGAPPGPRITKLKIDLKRKAEGVADGEPSLKRQASADSIGGPAFGNGVTIKTKKSGLIKKEKVDRGDGGVAREKEKSKEKSKVQQKDKPKEKKSLIVKLKFRKNPEVLGRFMQE